MHNFMTPSFTPVDEFRIQYSYSKCTVVYAGCVQLVVCKLLLTVDRWLVDCVNS